MAISGGTPFVSSTFSRTTGGLSRTTLTSNLTRSQAEIQRLQDQLSTGRRILTPSDDPINTVRVLNFTSQLQRNTQFSSNITTLQGGLEMTDSTLGDLTEIAGQAEDLLLQEMNDSSTAQTRTLSAQAVDGMISSALSQANAKFEDRYLFSGSRTDRKPFELIAGAVLYTGNREELQHNIADGLTIGGNLAADNAFGALTTEIAGNVAAVSDIDDATKLSTLNGGAGVRLGSIRISGVAAGPLVSSATIDLSIAETIGDVRDLINAQTAVTGVTAVIDPVAGDRIALTAAAGTTVYAQEMNNGFTAGDLGLKGHAAGTADAASTLNTVVDAELAGLLPNDYFNGRLVRIAGGPGPATARVSDYNGATGTFTLDVTYSVSLAGATYEVIGTPPGNPLKTGAATAVGTPTTFVDAGLIGLPDNYFDGMVARFTAGPNVPVGGVRHATITGFNGATGTVTVEATPDIAAAFDATTRYAILRPGLDPAVTTDIPLSRLNNGVGIDLAGLTITNKAPTQTFSASISFAGMTTLEEAVNAINQSNTYVTAEVNGDGTGLNLVSRLNGARLTVAENGAGRTLRDLGLTRPLARVALSDLNGGAGLQTASTGADFRISLRGTVAGDADFDITLGKASTVQDVIDLIAQQTATAGFPGGRLLAQVDPLTGDRLQLIDRAADGGTMAVTMQNGSFASDGLGITATSAVAGDALTGTGLNPAGVQSDSIFTGLIRLRDGLFANDRGAINAAHARITAGRDRLLDGRAEAGSRLVRLEMTRARHDEEGTILEGLRSDLRDADLADTATRFQLEQVVLQSGLAAAAKILQTTLLSYL